MADISIIIPVFNGEKWISDCMTSIAEQSILSTLLKIEIVVFNDGSTDESAELLLKWQDYFTLHNVPFLIIGSTYSCGCGASKNAAVLRSSGKYLCFQDIDDVMKCDRIYMQYKAAKSNHNALVGSKILRVPPGSTPRFVKWANNLSQEQLKTQIFTANGSTILMPTWFCHRSVYDKVGGFVETGQGAPEDLIFFHSHLVNGGDIIRVDEKLVIYTYHKSATTFSISRKCIWDIQLEILEKQILPKWDSFTVWNAGKAGRKFVRSLSKINLIKVKSFCDVDIKKIGRIIELYNPLSRTVEIKLPVLHFSEVNPPLIICMKLDLTNGQFENNLQSLNLIEGKDYILFN